VGKKVKSKPLKMVLLFVQAARLVWFGVGFGHKILAGTSPNV
jgi:hypothetical protein